MFDDKFNASELLLPYLEMARKQKDFKSFAFLMGPRPKAKGFGSKLHTIKK